MAKTTSSTSNMDVLGTGVPGISIIVPVMNEAGNITPLVTDIISAFHGCNIEIIYIDDASSDNTASELKSLQQNIKCLRVLTHSLRSGQSAALRSGIIAATAPLIGTLDGDGQNLPSDLVKLAQVLNAHRADSANPDGLLMAAGVRVHRQDGAAKRYASIAARKIRKWMLKDDHPDTGCATKVFDRELFLKLPYFDHLHRFMPPLARREGATVLAVPVGHAPRITGISKYRTMDRLIVGISDILGVMWLIRRSPKNLKVKE